VINRDPSDWGKDYVTQWREFVFVPGSLEALTELTRRGYRIVVISNQAGVGKGVYPQSALDAITARMIEEIEARGAKIYSVQYCTHTADDRCDCRKPKAGLFKKATEGRSVDLGSTYFIGDMERDIEAGKNAGCRTILVLSGKTKNRADVEGWAAKPDLIKGDLKEAIGVMK